MEDFPKIISVDDHVIEPPNVWQDRLPEKYKAVGPRVERHPVKSMTFIGGKFAYEMGEEGSDGPVADWWMFEDKAIPHTRLAAAVGVPREEVTVTPITYEDMRPGCFDQKARIEDMDVNWTEAQMCFPTMPRFCGQTFTEMHDKELGLLCVQAYNDWMVDEWCAGTDGRLIPLMIVPLWDPQLAADEVRRNAARGVTATCFSEIPPFLGLPSIHSGEWDPFFEACNETGVVVNMHIGSSSRMPSTSEDAPPMVGSTMTFANCMMSMVDFMMSGVLVRYPNLKLAYAEGQLGWIPYILERADKVWEHNRGWGAVGDAVPEPPSTYYYRQMYACFFDDEFGLTEEALNRIGPSNIVFETDYPHSDSTWPHTKEVASKLMGHLSPELQRKLVRGNAIELLQLDFQP
ncbi:MAG: amidohydrolase [Acidimicrobiales bacterium]|nr:amidohydrolase [Acidimicrobiales bacterium]